MLTAILWWGRIDDLSCRLLTDAFRAIDPSQPVRIHAFAAVARDLFQYTLRNLTACHKGRHGAGCVGRAARRGRREELLAAIGDLRNRTRLRPPVILVQGAEAAASLNKALSAVLKMTDSIADFLDQVLQPLPRAFVLEIRAEFDDVAPRRMDPQVYTESLIVTQVSTKSMCVELEACPASTTPAGSSLQVGRIPLQRPQ